jgi:hypothetical protein
MLHAMTSARLPALAAFTLACLAAACAPTSAPPPGAPRPTPGAAATFRPGDFAWSTARGAGRVEGRMTLRRGAVRYSCSGAGVVLTPETPWTRRRMTILYRSAERAALPSSEVRARTPSAPSGDYSSFVKRTTCDVNSRFSFTGVPSGAWYVITIARPLGGAGEELAVMRRVQVTNGRTVMADL